MPQKQHFDPRVGFETPDDQESHKISWSSKSVDVATEAISKGYPLRTSPFFKNNLLLRNCDLLYNYKDEELLEYTKCKIDILHFAEKYCWLKSPSGRTRPIKLRKYQRRILIAIQENPYTIILAGRQIGKTTTTAIAIMWFVAFQAEFTVALLGDKHATAIENLDKVKEIYYTLPFFLKPGVIAWNVKTVVFDTKSKIMTGPCKKSAIVGKSINLLYIDELAIPLPSQSKEVVEYAMPTMETFIKDGMGKVVFSSTPNGENIFKDFWVKAVRKTNGFIPVAVKWWEVPGRDLAWKHETMLKYGEESFNEQFNCIFLSSASSFYSNHLIENTERSLTNYKKIDTGVDEINKLQWRIMDMDAPCTEAEPVEFLSFADHIDIDGLKDKHVIIQMDIAEGAGLDFTVANIFMLCADDNKNDKKTKERIKQIDKWNPDYDGHTGVYYDDSTITDNVKLEQIGLFHTNLISIPAFAMFIRIICHKLFDINKIRICPEINKYGGHLKALLMSERFSEFELDIENFAMTQWNDKNIVGVNITSKTKPLYVRQSKTLLETGKIKINEVRTIEEMKYFGKVKNSYGAHEGHHDDIMMTIVGVSAYVSQENISWVEFCEEFVENVPIAKAEEEVYD